MIRARTAAILTTVGGTIVLCVAATHAYSYYAKWASSPVLFYANPQNADVDSAAAEAALKAGAAVWHSQSNASIDFEYAGRVNDTSTAYDGRNVVIFRNATSGSG